MRTGKLSRQNTWTAISTTIWRTLSYPLSSLNLTRQQCDKIMAPILKYGLPAMGVCQNFPQKVVFFPVDFMGLGWTHLHTSQEIMRLEVLIKHTYLKTTTGELYRTSLELLFIELGLGLQLHLISYPDMAQMASNSLVKITWKFLWDNEVELRHEIELETQWTGDNSLMNSFISLGANREGLLALNRCHLYLQAYFISDLVDGSGE